MESMEPKDIDWSRVVSRYVRDDTYEGIHAPRWADLDDPDAVAVDDHAWFCRPGTHHALRLISSRIITSDPASASARARQSERETNRADLPMDSA
jgi:hypothetical protein